MITVNNKKSFILYVAGVLIAVVLVNMISRNWFFRLDFTDNKMYSISQSSKKVLDKIDDLMTLKVYFSDNLPGDYGNNRRYLQDILEEYEAFSGGNIRFEFYPPEDDVKLEEEAQKYGIQPVQLQVIENDKVEIKKVYMGMVFIYEDKREVIPVIQTTTGLEYDITNSIKKLVIERKKTIGFAQFGVQEVPTQFLTELLSQSYSVSPVDLSSPVPVDVDLLLVNGVEDSLTVDEEKNFRDLLARGGNVFIAQNRVQADIQKQTAEPILSNFFSIIEDYGLVINENLVLDKQCGQVTISQNRGFFRMNSQIDYPFFPLVRDFSDHVTVNGLEQLRTLFTSEISSLNPFLADSLNVNSPGFQPLFRTSDKSTTVEQFYNLNPMENPAFNMLNQPGKVIAALANVKSDSTGAVSQIILVGDSRLFADDGGGKIPENSIFVLNAVDYLMGDSDLVALRSREITTRPLEEIEDASRARWKWFNRLLPSILVILFGAVHWKSQGKRSKMLEEIYE